MTAAPENLAIISGVVKGDNSGSGGIPGGGSIGGIIILGGIPGGGIPGGMPGGMPGETPCSCLNLMPLGGVAELEADSKLESALEDPRSSVAIIGTGRIRSKAC